MRYEKLYIHGAWDSKGFHIFPPTAKGQEIDTGVVKELDMIKGHSELFKVERRGSRFYYSYVRYNLISATKANRQGCNLGFTYVFDEGSQVYVLNDLLGLRKVLKQATNGLFNGNGIIITSDEDDRVTTAMRYIRQYTATASATAIKTTNSQGQTSIAFDGVTNEKILTSLQTNQTVIISPNISNEVQRLQKELDYRDKQIAALNELIVALTSKVDNVGRNVKSLLDREKSNKRWSEVLKSLLPIFNTILLLILVIMFSVNSCRSEQIKPEPSEAKQNKTELQKETKQKKQAEKQKHSEHEQRQKGKTVEKNIVLSKESSNGWEIVISGEGYKDNKFKDKTIIEVKPKYKGEDKKCYIWICNKLQKDNSRYKIDGNTEIRIKLTSDEAGKDILAEKTIRKST